MAGPSSPIYEGECAIEAHKGLKIKPYAEEGTPSLGSPVPVDRGADIIVIDEADGHSPGNQLAPNAEPLAVTMPKVLIKKE